MAIIETKVYECDCCGRQSDESDFNTGDVCGAGALTLSGHTGWMRYNGDWGGSNYSIKKLLCFSCAEKVTEFLRELTKQSRDSQPSAH